MVGDQFFFDPISIQQDRGASGVFAKDRIAFLQTGESPFRKVVQISDGSGNDVKQKIDSRIKGGTQIRTEGWRLCRPLPYHLAMPPKGSHYAEKP